MLLCVCRTTFLLARNGNDVMWRIGQYAISTLYVTGWSKLNVCTSVHDSTKKCNVNGTLGCVGWKRAFARRW